MNLGLGDTGLILAECRAQGLSIPQTAYVLATALHESAHTMKPVREYGGEAYLRAKPYYPFVGMGYVQLTWEENYARAGRKMGVDFVGQPELLLDPRYAVPILVRGMMQGWFTGRALPDYVNDQKADYVQARRVVNILDRAGHIADLARRYEAALRAQDTGASPMAKYNDAILAAAGEYLGLEEWPGARHNPAILKMWADIGITGSYFEKDETPWCAAFANAILAQLGLPHTGSGMAKSFDTYGTEVQLKDILPGDLIRFWRGSPSSDAGHIAIFVRFGSGNTVVVRGGNQGNKVSDAEYPISRIVSIRRADGVAATGKRPVLREGDRGAFVLDLQKQLVDLGYTLGKLDGIFGSRTLSQVVAFQADSDLTSDGIVGPKTWAALAEGETRMERDVTEEDLAGKSRTYDTAASGKNVATVGGAVASASVVLSEAQNAVGMAQEAETLLERVGGIAPSVIAIVGIVVVAYFAYRHFENIKQIRLDDARTGANDRI
jgi:uncharacterized protein (TIGR02594 family)